MGKGNKFSNLEGFWYANDENGRKILDYFAGHLKVNFENKDTYVIFSVDL